MVYRGYQGKYNNHKTRNMNEFIYCAYLDTVKKVKFLTEPFSLYSEISKKRKIPDIVYYDGSKDCPVIVEIKGSIADRDNVVMDYCTNKYISRELFDYVFVALTDKSKKRYITQIEQAIGRDKWKEMFNAYREAGRNSTHYHGFPGHLNPNFGNKLEGKSKIKHRAAMELRDYTGVNNPNYSKHLSTEAKKNVGAKWYDPVQKAAIVKKGFITHISRMTPNQRQIYLEYATAILSNQKYKKPDFVNRTYGVNQPKIDKYFGNAENFISAIKEIICQE